MQHKILKNAAILASLVVLILTFIYYADPGSEPSASPGSVKQINRQAQKPVEHMEKSVFRATSPLPDNQTVAEVKKEALKPTFNNAGTGEPPSQVQAKPTVEPKTTPPTVVEVSRSAANTYANSGYPLLSKQKGSYGQFYYRDVSSGRIEIDPQWVKENIVTIILPGLNQAVEVHKEAADNFLTAFNYIKDGTAVINGQQVSLLSLVKTMDGTFVTRHVNWNPTRGLSNHSWGIAIDINAANHFCYIDPTTESGDPNLILWEKAFKPAGFSWGNSYADSMHFELLD